MPSLLWIVFQVWWWAIRHKIRPKMMVTQCSETIGRQLSISGSYLTIWKWIFLDSDHVKLIGKWPASSQSKTASRKCILWNPDHRKHSDEEKKCPLKKICAHLRNPWLKESLPRARFARDAEAAEKMSHENWEIGSSIAIEFSRQQTGHWRIGNAVENMDDLSWIFRAWRYQDDLLI